MAVFEMNTNDIESIVYKKFDNAIKFMDSTLTILDRQRLNLSFYSGDGIEYITNDLKKVVDDIKDCRTELSEEENTLKCIVDAVVRYETSAYGIISGEAINEKTSANSSDTIHMSKDDFQKLIDQFKYYSQRSGETDAFYKLLKKLHSVSGGLDLRKEDYIALRDLFNILIHKDDGAAYVYSEVIPNNVEEKLKENGYSAKYTAEYNATKMVVAYGCDGQTVEYTLKIGTASFEAFAGMELPTFTEDDMQKFEDALSKASNTEEAKLVLAEFGIEIKGEIEGITLDVVTTKEVTDDVSVYSKVSMTFGEAYIKADFLHSEVNSDNTVENTLLDVGIGASAAEMTSSVGIKTKDGTYALKGGISAGVQLAMKLDSEPEIKAALFSLGIEIDDGFNYYEWLYF